MKAIIFNSGLGKRMGELTAHCHKSMVRLQNHEAIFERQLRILHECGITEFVVTVGPFKEQLIEASRAAHLQGCRFTFVENPIYDKTNYIYSMYLAREYITGDVLMLHGDLVFDARLVETILGLKMPSLGCMNKQKPLPEKDFKARVKDDCVQEVSVNIFDGDCYAFQPFYKLCAADTAAWVRQVERFVEAGETGCYAENAMNEIFPQLQVSAFDYSSMCYVDEVDNAEDLARVSEEIRRYDFCEQPIIRFDYFKNRNPLPSDLSFFNDVLRRNGLQKPFVVCGVPKELFAPVFPFDYTLFTDFTPNPTYEEVCAGVAAFRESGCDSILSIGGGSAIDVAKCIKLFAAMKDGVPYIEQEHVFSAVKHIAIPTTAGTGSESTRFAVIYYNGMKQSVTDDCILPDIAVLSPSLLTGLPLYQKKATLLDALCHAVESMWSVNAFDGSRCYAELALACILPYYRNYLNGEEDVARDILEGANWAGKAINLSQTTAAHAMSYKLTSTFGIAHGHAAALCLPEVWRFIARHTLECTDKSDSDELRMTLDKLAELWGVKGEKNPEQAAARFEALFDELGLEHIHCHDPATLEMLAASVNPQRLGNTPVTMGYEDLLEMYKRILA